MYELKVGAGKVCIDPPDGMYPMHTRFSVCAEKYNSCYCRSVILDNGKKRVLLVSYELSDQPQVSELGEILGRAAGVPGEYVVISVTHNHASPCDSKQASQVPFLTEDDKSKLRQYRELLIECGIRSARAATESLRPARYGYGECDSYINVNRNRKTPLGRWVAGSNYAAYSDRTLSMIKFTDLEGRLIAAILNHATHAGIGMGEKTASSFPGVACEFVEEYFGNGSVVMWTSGAAGDQEIIPVGELLMQYPDGYVERIEASGPELKYAQMEVLGRSHGADAAAGLDSITEYRSCMPIKHLHTSVMLTAQKKAGGPSGLAPSQIGIFKESTVSAGSKLRPKSPAPDGYNPNIYGLPEMEEDPGHPVEMKMQLLLLGDIAVVCAGAELFSAIGKNIRDASPYKRTVIITHTQEGEHVGYVPDQSAVGCRLFECYGKIMPGQSDAAITEKAKELFSAALGQE